MELKKCSQCGGNLKRLRLKKAWTCPYCNALYEDTENEKIDNSNYYGLNNEIFKIEGNLDNVMAKDAGAGCIRSIVHCMETFETAVQIEEYMLKKLSPSDDISMVGIREDQIQKAMPMLKDALEDGERIIVYGNKGILSKGKEYFVITDKRCIFVNKKSLKSVIHNDIDTIKIESCGNCTINSDYEKCIVNLDGNGTFQGAVIALMCLLTFESQPDREYIRII